MRVSFKESFGRISSFKNLHWYKKKCRKKTEKTKRILLFMYEQKKSVYFLSTFLRHKLEGL